MAFVAERVRVVEAMLVYVSVLILVPDKGEETVIFRSFVSPSEVSVPSVTSISADYAVYSFIVVVATPAVKVKGVIAPKFMSVGVVFEQVGSLLFGEMFAPEKVRS